MPDPVSPICEAREYTSSGPSAWSVGGSGVGSDGNRYDWAVNVDTYTGPGTYKPTSARQGGGEFSATADSGMFWGGLVTTAQNTITINADQGSGSFDVTIVSGQNSSLPFNSELRLTGTFACPFHRY
jgi:hypothetical protein